MSIKRKQRRGLRFGFGFRLQTDWLIFLTTGQHTPQDGSRSNTNIILSLRYDMHVMFIYLPAACEAAVACIHTYTHV